MSTLEIGALRYTIFLCKMNLASYKTFVELRETEIQKGLTFTICSKNVGIEGAV